METPGERCGAAEGGDTPAPGTLQVRVVQRIGEIAAADWDVVRGALTPNR